MPKVTLEMMDPERMTKNQKLLVEVLEKQRQAFLPAFEKILKKLAKMDRQQKMDRKERGKAISKGMKKAAKKKGYKYGRKSMVDMATLKRCQREGMSQASIARVLGISAARVNQLVKKQRRAS